MKHADFLNILPPQITGSEIEAEATVELNDETSAIRCYQSSRTKLLDVTHWHDIAGWPSASFVVYDSDKKPVIRSVQQGDYIQIDIPGPGSSAGEGYDWVFVEEVKEINSKGVQAMGFRVRPHANPLSGREGIAHFYARESSSTFMVIRDNNTVMAWFVESNLKPNDEPGSVVDGIRNIAISLGGMALFSKLQWKGLAEGLIHS